MAGYLEWSIEKHGVPPEPTSDFGPLFKHAARSTATPRPRQEQAGVKASSGRRRGTSTRRDRPAANAKRPPSQKRRRSEPARGVTRSTRSAHGLRPGMANPRGHNVCYLNSLLQALLSIASVCEFVLSAVTDGTADAVAHAFARLVKASRGRHGNRPGAPLSSTGVLEALPIHERAKFDRGVQHDAHEALVSLVHGGVLRDFWARSAWTPLVQVARCVSCGYERRHLARRAIAIMVHFPAAPEPPRTARGRRRSMYCVQQLLDAQEQESGEVVEYNCREKIAAPRSWWSWWPGAGTAEAEYCSGKEIEQWWEFDLQGKVRRAGAHAAGVNRNRARRRCVDCNTNDLNVGRSAAGSLDLKRVRNPCGGARVPVEGAIEEAQGGTGISVAIDSGAKAHKSCAEASGAAIASARRFTCVLSCTWSTTSSG